MTAERLMSWLSGSMLVVAAIAAASLIAEYGFFLDRGTLVILHFVDLCVVGLFVLDPVVRFWFARKKAAFLKARWPSAVIVLLFAAQLIAVAVLRSRGALPPFLEERTVFSIARGYVLVLQISMVFFILIEMVRVNRRMASLRVRPARTVMLSFVFVIFVGALLLSVPRSTPGGDIPVVDAFFTATSAVCVTGLTVRETGSGFTSFGHGVILALIQIGGLGLITFTAFFAIVMRRGLGVKETLVLRGMLTFETVGRIGRTLKYMIGLTLGLEAIGALALFLLSRGDFSGTGQAIRVSVFHSISAFCNAGLSLFATSFERYGDNIPINLVMTSLIIVGGLGFPVLMNVLGRRPLAMGKATSRWSLHARVVLTMTAALLVLGTLLFYLLERDGMLLGCSVGEGLLKSYFASVTARTAGFNTVRTAWLGLPTLFMLAALMFIGGSPGGTAGGVKTSTLGIVLASIFSSFGGKDRVELYHRRVPNLVVREALVVVAMGILVVSFGGFVLLTVEDLPLSDVLFEVVSAFGTVGLSTGVTPGLSAAGKIVLMLIMLTGRIGPLTLALAIGQRGEKHLYDYPEERVVIG